MGGRHGFGGSRRFKRRVCALAFMVFWAQGNGITCNRHNMEFGIGGLSLNTFNGV